MKFCWVISQAALLLALGACQSVIIVESGSDKPEHVEIVSKKSIDVRR